MVGTGSVGVGTSTGGTSSPGPGSSGGSVGSIAICISPATSGGIHNENVVMVAGLLPSLTGTAIGFATVAIIRSACPNPDNSGGRHAEPTAHDICWLGISICFANRIDGLAAVEDISSTARFDVALSRQGPVPGLATSSHLMHASACRLRASARALPQAGLRSAQAFTLVLQWRWRGRVGGNALRHDRAAPGSTLQKIAVIIHLMNV